MCSPFCPSKHIWQKGRPLSASVPGEQRGSPCPPHLLGFLNARSHFAKQQIPSHPFSPASRPQVTYFLLIPQHQPDASAVQTLTRTLCSRCIGVHACTLIHTPTHVHVCTQLFLHLRPHILMGSPSVCSICPVLPILKTPPPHPYPKTPIMEAPLSGTQHLGKQEGRGSHCASSTP